jgi:hypothetical protein
VKLNIRDSMKKKQKGSMKKQKEKSLKKKRLKKRDYKKRLYTKSLMNNQDTKIMVMIIVKSMK